MKVFQALNCGKGGFTELPVPHIENDQLLIKVAYCGICGTDYALFSGNSSFIKNGLATYPIRLGHEWSGIVAKIGNAVFDFKIGDRVVGDNYVSCGQCDNCLNSDYNNCTRRCHVGTIDPCWPGAFAEYIVMPCRHVYHIGNTLPLMEAALCEPLSIAYGGIKKMNITGESIVAVIGTGCIGMSAAALAKYRGAGQVYLIGRNPYKLDMARRLGITNVIDIRQGPAEEQLMKLTSGKKADFVLECSGSPSSVMQSIRIAEQKGKIALIGFYEQTLDGIDIDLLVSKELSVVGIMGEYGNVSESLKIMQNTDLHLSHLITSVVDFDECAPAFAPADHKSIIKTMVRMLE
ncbi:MAG: alcohol dehydrogenase catalytic domain-containing protein [Clostridiaceae bacterium]|nr:alcohol dehydrogenase catalytic domain-containing protein [Clostridiaceae bacterium]